MGSVASYIDTPPLYTYCASKSGVLGLMRGLRTQLLKHNISVNMIAPWFTSEIPLLKPFFPKLLVTLASSHCHGTGGHQEIVGRFTSEYA